LFGSPIYKTFLKQAVDLLSAYRHITILVPGAMSGVTEQCEHAILSLLQGYGSFI